MRPSSMDRRRFLELATLSFAVSAGCNQPADRPSDTRSTEQSSTPTRSTSETPSPSETERPSPDSEWTVDPVEHDLLIGGHYYPWFNSDEGWENWLERVPDRPVLGEYTSSNEDVINQHIKWAREAGINWFSVSWWGRDSDEDRIFRENVLEADLAEEISFSILYESLGRFQYGENETLDFDLAVNRSRLRSDFKYLEEAFFDHPSYLEIDGRPVVFFYLMPTFGGAVKQAFQAAKASIETEVYLIADILAAGPSLMYEDWMEEFDAASIYNIYSPDIVADREFDGFVDYIEKTSLDWYLAADNADVDLIPNVIPGYDDSLYRDNPVLERSPDGFRDLCNIGLERMNRDLDALLVTSFNEWPEYTAVEPSETYGETYLEIVKDQLAQGTPDYPGIDSYGRLQLEFNKTVRPVDVNPDSTDTRELALMLGDLVLERPNGETLVAYDIGEPADEPHLIEGAFGPGGNPDNLLETWRWLGGPTARATIYFDPEFADTAMIEMRGKPMVDDELKADISYDGTHLGSIQLGKRQREPNEYRISISDT